jgi:Rad3-related DNA helicase
MVPDGASAEETTETLCYLPDPSLTGLEIRELLLQGLAEHIEPAGVPRGAVRKTVRLPNSMLAEIRSLGAAQTPPLSPGKTVAGLLHALSLLATRRGSASPTTNLASVRPEQRRVLDAAIPQLLAGRVAISEAGTGVGKSRIAWYAAAAVLEAHRKGQLTFKPLMAEDVLAKESKAGRAGEERGRASMDAREERDPHVAQENVIVIAEPAVANITHMARELTMIRDTNETLASAKVEVALGRQQFVSSSRSLLLALSVVDEASQKSDVLSASLQAQAAALVSWVNEGMPAGQCEATTALASMLPDSRLFGLADDYRAIAPDLPVLECLLQADDDEDEQLPYRTARKQIADADIVLTTHATLAADNRALIMGAPALLPRTLCVIIDEAHLFESAQSNAVSLSASLLTLRSDVKALKGTTTVVTKLSALMSKLSGLSADVRVPASASATAADSALWAGCRAMLEEARDELRSQITKAGKKKKTAGEDKRRLFKIREAVSVMTSLLEGRNGVVSVSPLRRYPSLQSGPLSVAKYLAARWGVTHCGLLLSGTLLSPTTQGMSASMIINLLRLPHDRAVVTPPVHPNWLYATPTLYLPGTSTFHTMMPPVMKDRQSTAALTAWAESLATVFAEHIVDSAKGGTLVLMTGYERANALALALRPLAGDRLIAQSKTELPLTMALRQFNEMSEKGLRPIWIATGGAWTGIDIVDRRFSDAEAEHDLLLTDLVIPALPFGMNRTLTHMQRVENAGFVAEKQSALFMLRQGIGRLIRRSGLKHRRIWVLDGRLAHPGMQAVAQEAKGMLSSYERRLTV